MLQIIFLNWNLMKNKIIKRQSFINPIYKTLHECDLIYEVSLVRSTLWKLLAPSPYNVYEDIVLFEYGTSRYAMCICIYHCKNWDWNKINRKRTISLPFGETLSSPLWLARQWTADRFAMLQKYRKISCFDFHVPKVANSMY